MFYLQFGTFLLTLREIRCVVIDICDGDGDRGGGCAPRGHSSHVLSLDHNHILTLGFPVQFVCLAADQTCKTRQGQLRSDLAHKYRAHLPNE